MSELLSPLGDTPVPPLAPASLIKARGEQRRSRVRIGAALAAVVMVAGGAGTAVALSGGSDRDALTPSVQPSSATTCTFAADGDSAYTSSLCLTSDATPDSCTNSETARTATYCITSERRPLSPGELVTAQDAERITGGTWAAGSVVQDPAQLLIVCPTGDGYAGEGLRRTLSSGSRSVLSQVLRQPDAQRLLDGLASEVAQCPRRAADSGDGKASDSFRQLSSPASKDLLIEDTSRKCDTCSGTVHLYLAVASGDLLSILMLDASEAGHASAWAAAARFRLQILSGCATCAPALTHPAGFPDDASPQRGLRLYGVYVAVAATSADPALENAAAELGTRGYAASYGPLCDDGAAAGLDVPPSWSATAVYFNTRTDADRFVAAWNTAVDPDIAHAPVAVTTYCRD